LLRAIEYPELNNVMKWSGKSKIENAQRDLQVSRRSREDDVGVRLKFPRSFREVSASRVGTSALGLFRQAFVSVSRLPSCLLAFCVSCSNCLQYLRMLFAWKTFRTASRSNHLLGRPNQLKRLTVRRWLSSTPDTTARIAEPGSRIRLRDYQEESIKSVLTYVNNGHKRLGVSLATGAGKTVVFTQLIDRVPTPDPKATQTLIVAHRRELVEQAARHCSNAYPNKTVEIELGNSHASGLADITIASIQSIMSKDRLEKFEPSRFKMILIDEAHHIVARQYLDLLEHFKLRTRQDDSPLLVGVSATFSRFDGVKLGAAIDHIVYHRDYVQMINDRWLSDVLFTTVKFKDTDLRRVKTGVNGDFLSSALSKAVNTTQNNDIAIRAWMQRCSSRKSTLVFCVNVQHVLDMAAVFREHGVDAHFVTADTPLWKRRNIIDDFKAGKFPVLLNVGVFTEGTDIPNIDCILLARPTKSRNLLIQMIGRGMRLHPEKENCHVLDMVSALNAGIVTTPTLYGLDPDYLLESANPEQLRDMAVPQEPGSPASGQLSGDGTFLLSNDASIEYTDYDSVTDLIEDTSGDRHIRRISQYSWVEVGKDDYILTESSRHVLRISRDSEAGAFKVKFLRRLPSASKVPYSRPVVVVEQAASFEDAVHAADMFAKTVFAYPLIAIGQPWRKSPATDAQVAYLNRFRGENEKLDCSRVTKGRAVDMITKLTHGARSRFQGIAAGQRRARKASEKEEELVSREQVKVGPVPM
jgi:ATP-dependent helicase IRC3